MEQRVPAPARPRGAFERLGELRPLLCPRPWIATGAIVLVLLVGLASIVRFQGVDLALGQSNGWPGWRGEWSPSPGDREGGLDVAELLPLYGLALLLAWPAMLTLGTIREVVDGVTRDRSDHRSEKQRSRVQATALVAAFLVVAGAWGLGLVAVRETWPDASRWIGLAVSLWLLLISILFVARGALRAMRRCTAPPHAVDEPGSSPTGC